MDKLEKLESNLLNEEQVECPLIHRFSEGLYMREIFMPAGTFVVGHEHTTEHFNVILKGRVRVMCDGETVEELAAPYTFVSKAGVRKVLYVVEDTIWQTLHPTEETDIDKLEATLVKHSEAFISHEQQQKVIG